MSNAPTPTEVFEKLVHGVTHRQVEDLPNLYATDAVVDHPMDPLGGPTLRGREQLAAHFRAGLTRTAQDFQARNVVVHQTTDPEVVVAEFEYHGTAHDGTPFAVPCVFVLRVRDGQIVASRDYVDHFAFARARGDLDALLPR
ncbi:nuclear transport factor 2 family protein [Saccharopolyspora sp. K220]|uniref:nuclear transport factor 2 family protein n=1 Tax=Saccharopolyspora soli TaxID=2926618 RepID=UPI001F583C74|nr:nuclear transport factor 2 family protein [Saccharopolyspora soli]MCI2419057.1 nuclear transport factor 2 family protein [Saccharopolyspora soli]